jgi:hypothetical protein
MKQRSSNDASSCGTIVDLVDSTLLHLRRKGIIPEDLFGLLLFESIEQSAGSTLGFLLLLAFLELPLSEALLWHFLSFFGIQPVSTASAALRFPFFSGDSLSLCFLALSCLFYISR